MKSRVLTCIVTLFAAVAILLALTATAKTSRKAGEWPAAAVVRIYSPVPSALCSSPPASSASYCPAPADTKFAPLQARLLQSPEVAVTVRERQTPQFQYVRRA
jgi:hypothetical protein